MIRNSPSRNLGLLLADATAGAVHDAALLLEPDLVPVGDRLPPRPLTRDGGLPRPIGHLSLAVRSSRLSQNVLATALPSPRSPEMVPAVAVHYRAVTKSRPAAVHIPPVPGLAGSAGVTEDG